MRKILSIILPFILFPLFIYLLFWQIFSFNMVEQTSMLPNISGLIVSNRLAYVTRDPARGDVIIFRENGRILVKRVIGIPGDTVAFYGGRVILNSCLLEEPYLSDDIMTDGDGFYTVPEGMYFVLGDNRDNSDDSRYFDEPYIERDQIIGRTFLDFKSFTNWEIVPKYRFSSESDMEDLFGPDSESVSGSVSTSF